MRINLKVNQRNAKKYKEILENFKNKIGKAKQKFKQIVRKCRKQKKLKNQKTLTDVKNDKILRNFNKYYKLKIFKINK